MLVTVLSALAIALYERLGFLITVTLLLFGLTAGIERKNLLYAALFSVGVTGLTYVLFTFALKSQLKQGIFGF